MKNLITLLISFFFVNTSYTITIKSLSQILNENLTVQYIKCLAPFNYEYLKFLQPSNKTEGVFDECFILDIPQGIVRGSKGAVFFGNDFIKEMIWAQRIDFLEPLINVENPYSISGKLVVIGQCVAESYCHFMHECLGRLALVEMKSIEYDYLYVSYLKPFVKEMLELWGVNFKKIIFANDISYAVQATKLIVPSFVINKSSELQAPGFHPHPTTSNYVKQRLLQGALQKNIDTSNFSKKVFISRKDAPFRKIINEDDIFELFKPYGFVRYELSTLTVSEQIMLMHNADIVVGEHGAGLTNILFCKQNSLVIELFQELIDSSNWWIANIANLKYVPVNILNQDISWAADWKNNIQKMNNAWSCSMVVPLDQIIKTIDSLKTELYL